MCTMFIAETNDNYLFEMANMRGKYVKVPHRLDFSFYFFTKDTVESKELVHGLRVKPVFNPEKISPSQVGVLKLHSDWEYIPGENDINVNSKHVKKMKEFFKTYKVLFAAVWEKVLDETRLTAFLQGFISLKELFKDFDFYEDYKEEIDEINDLEEFETFVKDNNLFNLWDK